MQSEIQSLENKKINELTDNDWEIIFKATQPVDYTKKCIICNKEFITNNSFQFSYHGKCCSKQCITNYLFKQANKDSK